jgi:Raf kinase inhibitor-like YbhB/YbcL family protein
MRRMIITLCLLGLACSHEESTGAGGDRHVLASLRTETRTAARLEITSPSFPAGGTIPLRHSAYGDGVAPALAWSAPPAGTRTMVLMMEDPDAMSARPFVHWLAWEIAPAPARLAEAGAGQTPVGLREGRNSRGRTGYFGPRPHGAKPHHYHFQLFALDASLALPAGSDREALLAAMNGHVLAAGDLVGLFAAPRAQAK